MLATRIGGIGEPIGGPFTSLHLVLLKMKQVFLNQCSTNSVMCLGGLYLVLIMFRASLTGTLVTRDTIYNKLTSKSFGFSYICLIISLKCVEFLVYKFGFC